MLSERSSKTRSRRSSRLGGFTLVEMMIALVVLVVGVFSVFTLVITAIQTDAEAMHFSIARTASQQQMEYWRLQPWNSIATGDGSTLAPPPPDHLPWNGSVAALPNGKFSTAVVDASAGAGGLYKVTVTVTWTEPGSQTDSVTEDTYLAQGGLNQH